MPLVKKKVTALKNPIVRIIIPAYNEEKSIVHVLKDIPKDLITEIIVVNNASTDKTAEVAQKFGATVVTEHKKGYGNACLCGMKHLVNDTDIVVFMDADYSDYPEDLPRLLEPILKNDVDMVIGSRTLGEREKGSMTTPQIFGNWLSTRLLKIIYSVKYTDLGPFRAIKYQALLKMKMQDKTFGWTVEMQLKAAKLKFNTSEVAVNYRKRIGKSKISGTIKGTILAGHKIIWTILKHI